MAFSHRSRAYKPLVSLNKASFGGVLVDQRWFAQTFALGITTSAMFAWLQTGMAGLPVSLVDICHSSKLYGEKGDWDLDIF